MTYFFFGAALAILACFSATSVAARAPACNVREAEGLRWPRGAQINDGPLAGHSFSGTCVYIAEDGALEVDAKCQLNVAGPTAGVAVQ